MTEKAIIKNYKNLSKLSANLLTSPDLITGDIDRLIEDFMEGFCRVLQAALDLSVTPTDIKEFHKQTEGEPDDLEIFNFISDKIESPRSYIIVNYFLANFLISFLKYTKPKYQSKLALEYQKVNVTEDVLNKIESTYNSLF
jgi:hypothetical protein